MTTLLLTALLACGGDSEVPECIDNGYCAEGQACVDDECVDVDCLTSAVCDVGEYCNAKTYSCVDGCLEDTDCIAGETCDTETRTCEAYGCRDTTLDCAIGSSCNQQTGECQDLGACQTCNQNNVDSCTTPGTYCLDIYLEREGFCYPECDRNGECPAGFYCYPGWPVGLLQTADVCIADCPYLSEAGYL